MMSRTLRVAVGLALGITTSLAVGAPMKHEEGAINGVHRAAPFMGPGMRAERFDRMADAIELSSAQREELDAMRKNARTTLKPHFKNIKDIRLQLKDAVGNNVPANEIEALSNKLGSAMAAMTVERLRIQASFRSILTEDQRQELESLREARKHPRRDRDAHPSK